MLARTRRPTGSHRQRPERSAWHGARPWIAAAIVGILVLSLYLALTIPQGTENVAPGKQEYDYGETLIQGPLMYTPTYNSCTDDYRPDYWVDCSRLLTVFGELPAVPADMVDVSNRVFRNAQGFVSLGRITQAYWKNREFYPGWSQTHFDEIYTTDRSDIVTPIGFGAYPSIVQIVTSGQTDKWTFTFFLKDGWGLTHWQGMVLDVEIPSAALKANFRDPLLDASGNPVTQDPAVAATMNPTFILGNDPIYEAYVDELLYPLEPSQRMVILEPNYPSFRSGWVRSISVEVSLRDLPTGTWFFIVRALTPTPEIGELYFYEYGNFYQPSGFGIVLFEGIIVVV